MQQHKQLSCYTSTLFLMFLPGCPARDTPRWRKAALQQGPRDEYPERGFLLLAAAFVVTIGLVAALLYCA